ncbi:MAG: dehydrogenase, partial [Planctomycetia bacterium]|nr:dehydrogenase [Planctomycetia bacterium]
MKRHWLGVILLLIATGDLFAQGYSPEEAVRRMSVPDGLQVQLVAGEPLVRQPVCIEFDDRGRLWVIQYLQYPNPAGLKRVKVDRYSRTVYDRIPEPPPKGPRGADRITILEDTDGDGRMDRSRDFIDGLNLTTGIAFGHGGVFVLNVPYLLFYPDRNRDDVPDGEPEVLLTGFGMEDAHSVANSLTWGPDGWLYGCQGSTVTANIRGIEFQQGVWRYHPLTRVFELFCEGGGNSWGLDFDAVGNLFYSTNWGGFVMLHGLQGANYVKAFGKHGALHNPHAYGFFDHVPHRDFRGGHVTAGGIVYQGDSFPDSFRGKYIA